MSFHQAGQERTVEKYRGVGALEGEKQLLTKNLEWLAEVECLAVHVHVPLVILVSLQSHGCCISGSARLMGKCWVCRLGANANEWVV